MTGREVFAAVCLTVLGLGCGCPMPDRSESAARRCVADNGTVEWEFDIPGGLSGCDGIEFDFLAEGLEEFDTFEVRFRSGKGGYLGLGEWPQLGRDAERLAEEVNVLRDLGCGGFVVFDFTERALDAMAFRMRQKEIGKQ